jgi:chloride channel protein, CIC family
VFTREGKLEAFAIWLPYRQGKGRCLDLMRSYPEAKGVMDFLIVESIHLFKESNVEEVSLGNAPLANADERLYGREEKAVRFLFGRLNRYYGYKSLYEFKKKYHPEWQGRYLGFQPNVNLLLAMMAWIKRIKHLPLFLKPAVGALMNWVLGILVFFSIAKIGVFGLGYGDLQTMLHGGMGGHEALILLFAKLAATTAVYAWGGAGGIFSPTLFFGAATGLAFTDLCRLTVPLQPNDQIALTVAGMSACLGAVVRAPITSILIVFEMTHQFSFVPLLMIGTIASQAVSRALCHTNFYSEIIERDKIELERHIPPRSFASLQMRPISTLANFSPIFASSPDRSELQRLCDEHPYQKFPLVMDGQLLGLLDRNEILNGQSAKIPIEPADAVPAHATIREAVAKMVGNSRSLLVVLSTVENVPIGIVTLHDVLRLQQQQSDAV